MALPGLLAHNPLSLLDISFVGILSKSGGLEHVRTRMEVAPNVSKDVGNELRTPTNDDRFPVGRPMFGWTADFRSDRPDS